MNVLKKVYNFGISEQLEPEDAKYIGMTNLGALIMMSTVPPIALFFFMKGWMLLVIEQLVFGALMVPIFFLNGIHKRTPALVWFGSFLDIHLVITSVAFGWDIEVHYLIFFRAWGSIMLFKRDQTNLMVVSIIISIMIYYGAFTLSIWIHPLYDLEPSEQFKLNAVIEVLFIILIIGNALISRYGAIAAEDELKREKRKTDSLFMKLSKLDRQKTIFFQNISHEFRTPLTLIIGPLQDALSGTSEFLNQIGRRQVKMMLRNARHLLGLINQLLDLSRLDAGKMVVRPVQGDLVAFCRNVSDLFFPSAEKSGIRLIFVNKCEQPQLIFDPEMLKKILFNLISNAVKFTPPAGEIRISVYDNHQNNSARISVRDTGPGIPDHEILNIFDRFTQVDGTATREKQGTGIGLALVKELVEIQGWKIEANNTIRQGTEFIVTIFRESLHQVNNDPATEFHQIETEPYQALIDLEDEETEIRETHPSDENSKCILVVEDNRDMRAYIRRCLEIQYTVIEAENGCEGYDSAVKNKPDLIVSDVMMPGLDGIQMCKLIRENPETGHIPIVLLTAKVSENVFIEGLESGAYDCLSKPFSRKVLLAKLDGLLLRQREQQQKELAQEREHREKTIQERLRISRDIHDSIGSELTSLILRLDSISHRSETCDKSNSYTQEMSTLAGQVRITLEKLRDIVYILHQPENFSIRLEDEILGFIERLQQTGKYSVNHKIEAISSQLEMGENLNLLRIFQEWMTNTIRHADAKNVEIRWFRKRSRIYLVIINDGKGFSWRFKGDLGGTGLKGIAARVRTLKAKARALNLQSQGTLFLVSIPTGQERPISSV